MTSWTEILKANKGLYARDSFSELWGLKLKAARAEFPDYTITGTLPLSFNSRVAGALKNYRIYGTSAGSGTPTESGEPAGYKIPILCQSGVTENLFDPDTRVLNKYLYNDGTTQPAEDDISTTDFIPVKPNTTYTITATGSRRIKGFYADKTVIRTDTYDDYYIDFTGGTFTTGQQTRYIRFSIQPEYVGTCMLVKGSTPPSSYIPHRYQSNYDLFVGDSKLGAEEYVDYGEQKIYKRTEQLLLPYNMDSGASEKSKYISTIGTIRTSTIKNNYVCGYINVLPSTAYALKDFSGNTTAICYYDSNKNYISGEAYNNRGSFIVTTPANCYYVRMTVQDGNPNTNVFVKGNEIPETYIPYLQPTDPPVPFPAIQAYKGENTLDSTEMLGDVSITGQITEMT